MPLPHLGFASPDGPWPDGAGLLVPAEDFGDAAVRHSQLAGDDAGTDPVMGHLHDLVADVVGQRPAVDKNTPELIDPALAQWSRHWTERRQRKGLLFGEGQVAGRLFPTCIHHSRTIHTAHRYTGVQQASL